MKIIQIPFSKELEYPVSQNMLEAINFINVVTPRLKKLIGNQKLNIWCRGSSGAILAALLVNKLKTNDCLIFHIKKEGESSHSSNNFGDLTSNRKALNIVIDDFVYTGKTLQAIKEVLFENAFMVNILITSAIAMEKALPFFPEYLIVGKGLFHGSYKDNTLCTKSHDKKFNKTCIKLDELKMSSLLSLVQF